MKLMLTASQHVYVLVYVRYKGDPATSPRTKVRGNMVAVSYGRRNSPHTRLSTSLRRRYAHSPARRPLGHKVPQGWQAPGGSFYGSTIDKKKGRPGIGRRRGKHLRYPPTACRRERGAGSVFPSLESARFSVGVWESARFSVGVSESARFSVGVSESAGVRSFLWEFRSSCVIVSGFRAALDLDTYHIGT